MSNHDAFRDPGPLIMMSSLALALAAEVIEGTREHHTRTHSLSSEFVPTFQISFCRGQDRFELAFTVPGGRWSGMPVESSSLMRFLIHMRNSWLHWSGDVDRDVARFDSSIVPTTKYRAGFSATHHTLHVGLLTLVCTM